MYLAETTLQRMRKPWVFRCTCGFTKLYAMDREDSLREYCLSDHNLNMMADHIMETIPMIDYLEETGRL